jgi:hypothetical protein
MLKQESLTGYGAKIASYLSISNGIGIVRLDPSLTILDSNHGFMEMFDLSKNPAGEGIGNYLNLDKDGVQCDRQLKISCSSKTAGDTVNYCYLIQIDDGYLLFCERRLLTESRALQQMSIMNAELINMQRELVKKNIQLEMAKNELDQRVTELDAVLRRVRQLEGIIPICTYCKKIKDSQDNWQQLEQYVSERSEALFSHGMCPKCSEEQTGNFLDQIRD